MEIPKASSLILDDLIMPRRRSTTAPRRTGPVEAGGLSGRSVHHGRPRHADGPQGPGSVPATSPGSAREGLHDWKLLHRFRFGSRDRPGSSRFRGSLATQRSAASPFHGPRPAPHRPSAASLDNWRCAASPRWPGRLLEQAWGGTAYILRSTATAPATGRTPAWRRASTILRARLLEDARAGRRSGPHLLGEA